MFEYVVFKRGMLVILGFEIGGEVRRVIIVYFLDIIWY